MSSRRDTAGFTLIEMLTVMAVSATLLAITTKLFCDGWVAAHRSLADTRRDQTVYMLADRWRRTVHQTERDAWRATESGFTAGNHGVTCETNRVFFVEGTARKGVALPPGMQCRFAIEPQAEGADCAVMLVTWPAHRYRKVETNSVRIVACSRGPGDAE